MFFSVCFRAYAILLPKYFKAQIKSSTSKRSCLGTRRYSSCRHCACRCLSLWNLCKLVLPIWLPPRACSATLASGLAACWYSCLLWPWWLQLLLLFWSHATDTFSSATCSGLPLAGVKVIFSWHEHLRCTVYIMWRYHAGDYWNKRYFYLSSIVGITCDVHVALTPHFRTLNRSKRSSLLKCFFCATWFASRSSRPLLLSTETNLMSLSTVWTTAVYVKTRYLLCDGFFNNPLTQGSKIIIY